MGRSLTMALVALLASLAVAAGPVEAEEAVPVTAHYVQWVVAYAGTTCTSTVDGANVPTTTAWLYTIATKNCDGLLDVDRCSFTDGSVRDGFGPAPCDSGAILAINGTRAPEAGDAVNLYTHQHVEWTYDGRTFGGPVTGVATG